MGMKKYFLAIALIAVSLFSAGKASAAIMNLSLGNDTFGIGDKFSVDIKIDSEGASINAAQAALQFPKDILQVDSIDKSSSVFGFWLQEPAFDNNAGTVSFIGGTINAFSGKSLEVLQIVFKVKGAGTATLSLSDAAVTAADGSGTNVLSTTHGATVNSLTTIAAPAPGAKPTPPVSQIIPPPVQITRAPAPAKGTAAQPKLEIPLYPDPQGWSNISSPFLVRWNLPADIGEVATVISKNPDTNPTKSEGLFDNKTFVPLADGIWYLHVRFQNNLGWGPTAHYRLAVDTSPPPPFNVDIKEGNPTDTPAPNISFSGKDQLSGLDTYIIRIDQNDPIYTLKNKFTLPLLSPGKHILAIGAKDKAGNVTENSIDLEILPLTSPIISSLNTAVFSGEGGINIDGDALPNITVRLDLKAENDSLVYFTAVSSTPAGKWLAKIGQPLTKGKYYIEVKAEDARGALSFTVKSDTIVVRNRPFLTIYNIEISEFWFFFTIIIILIVAFIAGWYTNRLAKEQRGRKALIAERDVVNAYAIIKNDVDEMVKNYADGVISEDEASKMRFLLKRISNNVAKMQKYILQNIKEIQD